MDTLVRDPFRDVMPAFFGLTLERMLELKHPDAWGRFERGELTEAEFLAGFFADGRHFDHAGFRDAIRDAYAWVAGMEPLLARLCAANVSMHVLSNYPVWYRWIEERLGLSRYVSWSFVSCHLGLRTPDPAVFSAVLARLECEASQCLLIDDRLRNCEAAREVGMQAVLFSGDAVALTAELERHGLLSTQQPLRAPQSTR